MASGQRSTLLLVTACSFCGADVEIDQGCRNGPHTVEVKLLAEVTTKATAGDLVNTWLGLGADPDSGQVSDQPPAPAPVWRITERSVEVAQSRAHMWLTFAGRALQRAREGGPVRWGLITECWAFVVAVDHLRSCAVMAQGAATVAGVDGDIAVALNVFDTTAPDVQNMRNVLEHYDDAYVLGIGDEQQPTVKDRKKRVVDEALAAGWGIWVGYTDLPECEHPWLRIGPTDGDPATAAHHLDVDLTATYQAARQLWSVLYDAARKQGLEPTNQPTTTTATADQ
jgi:hypothetical protein